MPEPNPAEVAALVEREAIELYEEAAAASITLRLIGSIAVKLRCERYAPYMVALGRRPVRDIDFFAYSKQERSVKQLFERRRYTLDPAVRHSQEFGIKRLIYHHPDHLLKVDIFLDELVMAHTVDLSGRLELDAPTVTLADLMLSKLQIHEITENDLIDAAILLAEHDLGSDSGIELGRLTDVLGRDWGFYHSVLLNLDKLEEAIGRFATLPPEAADRVRRRIGTMREAMDVAPKSRKWRLRARVGPRLRWYEEVDEVDR